MLKLCKLHACPNGTLGLHLSRAPWDPYPWVSGIQDGSSAQRAGVLDGDTVLELNGCDVLGQKISHIAEHIGAHWKSGASYVTVLIWRNQPDGVTSCDDDSSDGKPQSEMAGNNNQQHQQQQHQSINQQSLQKFATCLQHIAQLLECPVCLEVIRPPGWQCCNGHVLCNNCRSRSVKCPICRVPLGPRGRCLMSDKLFTLLAESFPCNSVRHNDSNKSGNNNSAEEIKKCTQDFHNQPKCKEKIKEKNQIKATKHFQNPVKYEESFKERNRRSKSVVAVNAANDENVARDEQHKQMEERQLQANHVQYYTDNMARICLRRTGTSKVHQLDELKITKSHKEKFFQHGETEKMNNTSRKETLSSRSNMECNGCEKSLVVAAVDNHSGPARNVENCAINVRWWQSKRKDSDTSNNKYSNNNNNNNNNNDDHVIVKLNLKSNAKFADCLMDNSYNNHTKVIAVNKDVDKKNEDDCCKTQRKSHETRVEDKVAREVSRSTTRQMTLQRQQQQQQQQQQYQNYYCPTGKSCCCYVQSSTRATTTTTQKTFAMCAADGAAQAAMNKCLSTSSETNSKKNNKQEYVSAAKIAMKEKSEDQQLAAEEVTTKLSTQTAVAAIDVASTTADSNVWSATTTAAALAHNNCNQRLTKTSTTTTTTTRTRMTTSLPWDWQVFAHLTEVHHVAVAHYYGTFGARIRVNFMHSKSMPCINVRQGSNERQEGNTTEQQPQCHANNKNQMQQFFVARIPLTTQAAPSLDNGSTQEIATFKEQLNSASNVSCTTASKYAIFLWHLNLTDDVVENCNYDTIIESRRTGVRWFGAAHALAKTSWPQIHAEGHFMLHTVAAAASKAQQIIALWPGEQQPASCDDDKAGDCDDDDFFDIVIKIK